MPCNVLVTDERNAIGVNCKKWENENLDWKIRWSHTLSSARQPTEQWHLPASDTYRPATLTQSVDARLLLRDVHHTGADRYSQHVRVAARQLHARKKTGNDVTRAVVAAAHTAAITWLVRTQHTVTADALQQKRLQSIWRDHKKKEKKTQRI